MNTHTWKHNGYTLRVASWDDFNWCISLQSVLSNYVLARINFPNLVLRFPFVSETVQAI